jgi:hypothetical protein
MQQSMSQAATQLGSNICPHGAHRVFAGANGDSGLRQLPTWLRDTLVRMLCDVAEVAEVRPAVVDFWRDESLLQLRVGQAMVLYSVDRDAAVLVHQVIGDVSTAPTDQPTGTS